MILTKLATRISMKREYENIANTRSSSSFGVVSRLLHYKEGNYRKFIPLKGNLQIRVHRLDLLNNASSKFLNKFLALTLIQERCTTSIYIGLDYKGEEINTHDSILLL